MPSAVAESKPADEAEAAISAAAPAQPVANPAAAMRVGKPAAGRKQHAAPAARDGLRHAKQNYEKLAGVKRSRTKAAAARRLIASARRTHVAKRVVPRRSEQAASKGRKPPVQRKALPEAPPPPKKVRVEEPAAPVVEAASKAWKGPPAITLSAVRGRGSSRGGHLRQGSSRQTSAGALENTSTSSRCLGSATAADMPSCHPCTLFYETRYGGHIITCDIYDICISLKAAVVEMSCPMRCS